jgi:glycosidase
LKAVIYQLVVRYFGNTAGSNVPDGSIEQNGCGKFEDITSRALEELRALGITHVWLTGVPRQATLTDRSGSGLPADPADIVKGRAGSFYAVRDYGDVCADYATDPARRMAELSALVSRIHAAGLKVLIDWVPNHVSRSYSSATPGLDFGAGDDQTRFFDARNNFYYLVEPRGRALSLTKPAGWNPPGVSFSGRFAPEDGSAGHTPKATGGDDYSKVTDSNVPEQLWYETIKLNYGYNFADGTTHYDPRPSTWDKADAVLAFWQSKGVDGFRCDFAHYVPAEAWAYMIGKARERDARAFFIAEAYPFSGSRDPVQSQDQLLGAGFDAVYHYRSYNALKRIYQGATLDEYEREMSSLSDAERPRFMEYLENHDERRVPSPIVADVGSGDSGFGSADAGYQLAPLQLLYSQGPVLLLNGQEVGEPGAGASGFSGNDGRTTLFDYWRMPRFAEWVNGHTYDGGGLDPAGRALRRFYADLLALCQDPSICGRGYWGLRYHNRSWSAPGCSDWLYAFSRYQPGSGRLAVVAANFDPNGAATGSLRIPRELAASAGLAATGDAEVRLVLDEAGKHTSAGVATSVSALVSSGFQVSVSRQACNVYVIQ